jgi:hypothetical protein
MYHQSAELLVEAKKRGLLTMRQYARRFGLTTGTVRYRIKQGKIAGQVKVCTDRGRRGFWLLPDSPPPPVVKNPRRALTRRAGEPHGAIVNGPLAARIRLFVENHNRPPFTVTFHGVLDAAVMRGLEILEQEAHGKA